MLIKESNIRLDLKAQNKEGIIRELAEIIQQDCPQIELDTICRLVMERENIGSTGVGNGVAIPHARVKDLDSVLICFGHNHEGIGFDAIDNQPVHLFVMILSPENQPEEYLVTLAAVSRLMKKAEIRRQLRHAKDVMQIEKIFLDCM